MNVADRLETIKGNSSDDMIEVDISSESSTLSERADDIHACSCQILYSKKAQHVAETATYFFTGTIIGSGVIAASVGAISLPVFLPTVFIGFGCAVSCAIHANIIEYNICNYQS